MAGADDAALLQELLAYLEVAGTDPLSDSQIEGLGRALYCVKYHANKFPELIEKSKFILTSRPLDRDEKAEAALDTVSRSILSELTPQLQSASWEREKLEEIVSEIAQAHEMGLGKIAAPLRAALAGRTVTPSIFDMMLVLGRDETVARLAEAVGQD